MKLYDPTEILRRHAQEYTLLVPAATEVRIRRKLLRLAEDLNIPNRYVGHALSPTHGLVGYNVRKCRCVKCCYAHSGYHNRYKLWRSILRLAVAAPVPFFTANPPVRFDLRVSGGITAWETGKQRATARF